MTDTARLMALYIDRAEENATLPGNHGYGIYTAGRFQVYMVPVQQRTVIRRQHFRATFYVKLDDNPASKWIRKSRAEFVRLLSASQEVSK